MSKPSKQWKLLQFIARCPNGEVRLDDLDEANRQRLFHLVNIGKAVESRIGSWTGIPYYKLTPTEQKKWGYK